MIGEREIMIDVLLLPEMSRGGGAIGRSIIVSTLEGKSHCITPLGLYPRLGTRPGGLGKLQAVDLSCSGMCRYTSM